MIKGVSDQVATETPASSMELKGKEWSVASPQVLLGRETRSTMPRKDRFERRFPRIFAGLLQNTKDSVSSMSFCHPRDNLLREQLT